MFSETDPVSPHPHTIQPTFGGTLTVSAYDRRKCFVSGIYVSGNVWREVTDRADGSRGSRRSVESQTEMHTVSERAEILSRGIEEIEWFGISASRLRD